MVIAIVVNEDRLANHFAKAQNIAFYNEQNELIQISKNPAAEGNCCSGKKAALALLKEMKTEQILVRNIGQHMLSRLLDAGIRVFHSSTSDDIASLLMNKNTCCNELTSAEQGRISPKHADGHQCNKHSDKSGCSHHSDSSNKKSGCSTQNSKREHKCCTSNDHENSHNYHCNNDNHTMGKITGISPCS